MSGLRKTSRSLRMNERDQQISSENALPLNIKLSDCQGLPRFQSAGDSERGSRPFYTPLVDVTEVIFCDWTATAPVGHCIQYHEGLLLRDRSEISSDLSTKDRARIHSVARRAWIACELGLVHLFSQKVGEDHYRYLAMRSSTPLKPPEIRNQLRIAQMAPSNRKPH